jgi:hypothetical protein
MDEAVRQLETHIDRTRQRLGSNLKELEDRVDSVTDWRAQFRRRPYSFIGLALVGGACLSAALRSSPSRRKFGESESAASGSRGAGTARGQGLEIWENVRRALLGVAATRVRDYISELVPGFDEHFRRAEQRSATEAERPSTIEAPGGAG